MKIPHKLYWKVQIIIFKIIQVVKLYDTGLTRQQIERIIKHRGVMKLKTLDICFNAAIREVPRYLLQMAEQKIVEFSYLMHWNNLKYFVNWILFEKTCKTNASARHPVLCVPDPEAADDGIEDGDEEHSHQVDVVQVVCCGLRFLKQNIFYIFFLTIFIYTCVFYVDSTNDHEKYSNYCLKINHDNLNKTLLYYII